MVDLKDALNIIADENDWDDILICSKIIEVWKNLLSADFRTVAQVKLFEEGALYIKVRSSSWKAEIKIREIEFISHINNKLGKDYVKHIIVKT